MLLSDNETKVDLLNSEAIASTIVQLIIERPDHPITIGVHGDWGAGKSSVLEMIEAGLSGNKDVLCIKFNGWRFQGFEDAKIALIEGIVTELIEERSLLTNAKEAVREVYKRIDWLKLAKKTGGLALTAFTGVPTPDVIQSVIGGLESFINDPSKLATKENFQELVSNAKSVLKPKDDSKNVPEEIGEFRKAFDELLKKAGVKQLIVLIDDLDRCLPEIAIETLEAIRLFVFTSRTAFIVAADEGMIEYAVRRHFPDLSDTPGAQGYSRNYLEKLIQVPFRIPILGETETRIYVTLLLIGAELGEDDKDFNKLIAVARNLLKKPWESKPLDSVSIRTALGEKATKVQNALILSDQLGPILARGTKGNPRQIKRFLNTLILRQRMAEARGFGQDINLPILAKLMIAERFLSRLFEQVANSSAISPDGICKELALLEEKLNTEKEDSKQATVKKSASKKSEDKPDNKISNENIDDALLSEWQSSNDVKAWAAIQPSMSGVDLRPYIFVAKDKKDYFGNSSSLGYLSSLIDKLFGNKLSVQFLEPDLKKLTNNEAFQVFEVVRARIIEKSIFDTEPAGIQGLTVLIKSHVELQENLIDFLESLPVSKVGAWVVAGWDSIVTDKVQRQRFELLVDGWASSANSMLKVAALNVQKMRKAK